MFCDQCGTQLQVGQSNCARCGKPVVLANTYRKNRVQEHVRLLGILWLAYSGLMAVGAVVVWIVAQTVFGGMLRAPDGPPAEVIAWLHPLLTFISGLILVLAFVALFKPPLGTALGIYSLWVLLPTQSEDEYNAMSKAA